ncbi:MAG: DEAD/DEAH box helicase [Flavobacteriales bacterium]|nr:DEAD/DEAH box helicase [Flavobacteriales bacterium]
MSVFAQLGLKEEIVRAVSDLGFENPTSIQEQAIPLLLTEDSDLVGLAQTGTGKTAAFGLPMIHKIDFSNRQTQALVICPTRELCLQITSDLTNFSKYFQQSNIVAIYGGASIEMQARSIRRGAQIVVATPGRLMDMIDRRLVDISAIRIVVLDEADEMLNMGFKEDIDTILSNVPDERSTWLFSATMPREVAAISKNYMHNPKEITVGKQNSSNDNIEHQYFVVREKDRYFALKRVIDFYPEVFGIIFCRTKRETQEVSDKLIKDGYNCDALHGDLSQAQRDAVMKKFRDRTLQLLCATDVAARGIDVSDITHVINYNLPDDVENYTHRSGRTARAGKTGLSMVFVNTRETNRIRDIERVIKKSFVPRNIPNGKDICEKQLFALINKMVNVEVDEKGIAPYLEKAQHQLDYLSKEDLIKRFLSAEFNRFLEYYRHSEDLNVKDKHDRGDKRDRGSRNERGEGRGERGDRGDRGDRGSRRERDNNMQRLFVNIGEMDRVNKGMLVRLICDQAGINGNSIGRIDIRREFSFVDVETSLAEKVKGKVNGMVLEENGRKVRVDYSDRNVGGGGGEKSYGAKKSFSGKKNYSDRDNKESKGKSFDGKKKSEKGFRKSFI